MSKEFVWRGVKRARPHAGLPISCTMFGDETLNHRRYLLLERGKYRRKKRDTPSYGYSAGGKKKHMRNYFGGEFVAVFIHTDAVGIKGNSGFPGVSLCRSLFFTAPN